MLRLRNSLVFEIRPGRGDRFGFYEVLIKDDYTGGGQQLLPGDTVIDVGANIGCFSLLAAQRVGPSGRVIALEPEQAAFKQLQRNIEMNGMTNIVARRVALGATEGKVTLNIGTADLFNSICENVDGRTMRGEAQEVSLTTLDRIMVEERVDRCHYLKVDCEGAEYDIVSSMSPEIAHRINQITMEIHQVPGKNRAVIAQRLLELGFSLANQNSVCYFRR